MSSEYVARRIVDVAKRPRRSLVIPWWFRVITTFDTLFPVAVDLILYGFTRKNHQLDEKIRPPERTPGPSERKG
jgi:hypothetical protein